MGILSYGEYVGRTRRFPLPRKTLIKSLNNDSVRIINSTGSLSLSNNILAIKSPENHNFDRTVFLRVFRLKDNVVPRLILQRRGLDNARVQDNYLITVKRHKNRTVPDVYIKTIS